VSTSTSQKIRVVRGPEIGVLLRDLIGKPMQLKDLPAPPKTPDAFYEIAGYEREDGTLAASFAIDLPLAAGLAAALTLVPPGVAEDSIRAKKLEPMLEENLAEVLNVAGRFFNSPSSPRVILKSFFKPPCSGALAQLWATAPIRLAFEVTPAGYKPGKIAMVAN
jgi:hypothetical protein